MGNTLLVGSLLAILSGLMNGSFTLPMRFLGRWEWENVWSLFIAGSCLLMPAAIISAIAPRSWVVIGHAPAHAVWIAIAAGFAWGFGAIMFGQSVSAIGISLANTLVLAISSALGSLLPMLLLAPQKLFSSTGKMIIAGVAIEMVGIALCGTAGRQREQTIGVGAERGDLVGRARPLGMALLLATGAGVLSAVFNIGFALAQPVAEYGRGRGLSEFSSTNLIWWLMLAAGSVANLGFCGYLLAKNRSMAKFRQPGVARLFSLSVLMALLWGGSIFVYGAAAPRLGPLGTSIGWPLSLATGLLLANAIGVGLGEWRRVPARAKGLMYSGVAVLLVAIVVLSRANY
ncbi:MAG: L-rhamnose/proton symporter RhaT [Terriglobales bacterium]